MPVRLLFYYVYLLRSSFIKHLPIIRRRNAPLFLKDPAEIEGIIISNDGRDFSNVIIRGFQQGYGVADSDVQDVLHGRDLGNLLEIAHEPADAHASGLGKIFNGNGFVVVLAEITAGMFHFFL